LTYEKTKYHQLKQILSLLRGETKKSIDRIIFVNYSVIFYGNKDNKQIKEYITRNRCIPV